mgnify:CR=1 FL=1
MQNIVIIRNNLWGMDTYTCHDFVSLRKCKDIEFLTLLNLLDNYTPLVLSIYSIVFKCNKYELFCQSLLHCSVMFVVFQRRHYNKALLIILSAFSHLQENTSTIMLKTLRQNLVHLMNMPLRTFILYDEKEPRRLISTSLFIVIYICPSQKIHFSSKEIYS